MNLQGVFGFSSSGASASAITGAGTAPKMPVWAGANTLGDSQVTDNGTTVFIGASATSAKAKFEVKSTTQGALFPRMTTVQRDAIVVGATEDSLFIFNKSIKKYQYYNHTTTTWDTFANGIFSGSGIVPTTTIATLTDTLQLGSELFLNTTTNQVGINTVTPTPGFTLDVQGRIWASSTANHTIEALGKSAANPLVLLITAPDQVVGVNNAAGYNFASQGTDGIGARNYAGIYGYLTSRGVSQVGGGLIFKTTAVGIDLNSPSEAMRINPAGNVGIGFIEPLARLHTKGSGSTSATTAFLVQNSSSLASLTVLDDGSVYNLGGGSIATNLAYGKSALIANTTGIQNLAIGASALVVNTNGNYNVALGASALASNISGIDNIAIGFFALEANTGSSNIGIGQQALSKNIAGASNTAIGKYAMLNGTSGSFNTAIGMSAMKAVNTGNNNTAVGYLSLTANTSGTENVSVGESSMLSNTQGSRNVAIGKYALVTNAVGNDNVALGLSALHSNLGSDNIAFGYRTMFSNTSGANNVAIGRNALYSNSIGATNIALGYKAGYYETASDSLYIHNGLGVTDLATQKTNSLIYGVFNASVAAQTLRFNAKIGINTIPSATSWLTVNGDIETLTNTKGFVVLDRTNGNRYRIYTDGGVLNTELVP